MTTRKPKPPEAEAPAEVEPQLKFTPTPASEWKGDTGPLEVTLPSGNKAIIAKANMYILMRTGRMPPAVRAIVNSHEVKDWHEDDLTKKFTKEEVEFFFDWLVATSFVDPQVTLVPKKGCVHISKISQDDKDYVTMTLDLTL